MANAGKYDKYFYFRALEPSSAITNIRVWFESELNTHVQDKVSLQNGYVDLTCTRGKLKEVMATIVSAMNAGPHSDGVTVIADDVTTDYDGTLRSAKYLHNDITACSAINIG